MVLGLNIPIKGLLRLIMASKHPTLLVASLGGKKSADSLAGRSHITEKNPSKRESHQESSSNQASQG